MGHQGCMQSSQDYIIAVKKKRRDTIRKADSPGDAKTREACGVTWQGGLSWQFVGDACGDLRSYKARRFGPAAWREVP